MPTYLMLECSGCIAMAKGNLPLNRADMVRESVPEGWIWKDPYTGCTYCPKCWADIEGTEEEDDG